MPQGIDFDAVQVQIYTFTKRGRVWEVRDDFDALLMMEAYNIALDAPDLSASDAELRENPKKVREVVQQAKGLTERMGAICYGIFKNSYPDLAREALNAAFTFEEQAQIVQLFFTRRGSGSRNPPPNTATVSTSRTTTAMPANGTRKRNRHKPRMSGSISS